MQWCDRREFAGPSGRRLTTWKSAGGRAANGDVFILLNHGKQERTVTLPRPMRDVLAAGQTRSSVTLPRYGVAVLEAE